MEYKKFKLNVLTLAISVVIPVSSFAATPIDISHKGTSYLQSFLGKPGFTSANKNTLQELKRGVDFNHTMHVRAQQTYAGYPVWGSDILVHVVEGNPKAAGITGVVASANQAQTKMNGTLFQELDNDLRGTPAYVFTEAQAKLAFDRAVNLYQKEIGTQFEVVDHKKQLLVYVDEHNKAHFAFHVSIYGKNISGFPTIPTYILDASTFQVYKYWNEIKAAGLSNVKGGGFGGNLKMGKLIYDGETKAGHLPVLDIQRNNKTKTCYLLNKDAMIFNFKNGKLVEFNCIKPDEKHNNLYWNGDFDFVNGGYSPSNDALYSAKMVKDLYETWYHLPVLMKYEAAMPITMIMHTSETMRGGFPDQAVWDTWNQVMFFGDGRNVFYPLTSIDVTAHEISHGFTSQNSNLTNSEAESGALNEAFSDMAGQAIQYFVRGKADWKIGADITKRQDIAFRYFDLPSRNCYGIKEPGEGCSIDNMTQFNNYLKKHEKDVPEKVELQLGDVKYEIIVRDTRKPEVHNGCGIYDRVFYNIANSEGWNIKKAFDVMVQANRFYWTKNTTFKQAACGVIEATKDYKYDVATVTKAFSIVEIDVSDCDIKKT